MRRTHGAFDSLVPVGERFAGVWIIPYNLACYCAQLGRMEECREWFKKAMEIDADGVRRAAIDDPDLKALWESLGGELGCADGAKLWSEPHFRAGAIERV
jgi:hypothetical protein